MSKISCPNCASTNTCRIMYGMPAYTPELEQRIEAGKVHLGGCIIELDSPNRHCNECELDFDTHAPNIYLDIDGVLLANDLTPANYAKEFIATVLERYPHTPTGSRRIVMVTRAYQYSTSATYSIMRP